MSAFAITQIEKFIEEHPAETFYAFSIDSSLLCFNSVEAFEKTLEEYKAQWPSSYETEEQINRCRFNPGDWKYGRFASFAKSEEEAAENGFDLDLYDKHYYADDAEQKTSEYAVAINAVLAILQEKDVFKNLKKTPDFRIGRVEHNY